MELWGTVTYRAWCSAKEKWAIAQSPHTYHPYIVKYESLLFVARLSTYHARQTTKRLQVIEDLVKPGQREFPVVRIVYERSGCD